MTIFVLQTVLPAGILASRLLGVKAFGAQQQKSDNYSAQQQQRYRMGHEISAAGLVNLEACLGNNRRN
jgi:hypothetical protein